MPRPRRMRRIFKPPFIKGFQPIHFVPFETEPVILTLDEYEAVNLADYKNLPQHEAAEKMKISRPTFTRIYDSARKKIAKAMVEGRVLLIQGGDVEMPEVWFRCVRCNITFKVEPKKREIECPNCKKSDSLINLNRFFTGRRWRGGRFF